MTRDRLNSAPDRLEVSKEEMIQRRLMKTRHIETQMRSSANMEDLAEVPGLEEPGKYVCKICDKRFFHKNALETHKLVHSELDLSSSSEGSIPSTPQKCKICKKKFSSSVKRRLHDIKYHGEDMEREVLAVF